MDYKEKYNKLIEAIKVLQKTNPSDEGIQNWVNDNVSELKESEDENEKIKNSLIRWFKNSGFSYFTGFELSKIVAWLEKQGEPNLTKKQTTNAWKMIYCLMDNVKTLMDDKYTSSNSITNQDVDNIIDYIYHSLQNIIRNTIERERKKNLKKSKMAIKFI